LGEVYGDKKIHAFAGMLDDDIKKERVLSKELLIYYEKYGKSKSRLKSYTNGGEAPSANVGGELK
jgi:hypothetical protein